MFCDTAIFYGKALLASCPNPSLEEHPLSALCDCLFNIFAATFDIAGRSSSRNKRINHVVVKGTHLPWRKYYWNRKR